EQIIQRLKELDGAGAAVGLHGVLNSAEKFLQAARRLDDATASANAGFVAGKGSDDQARILNGAMKRLSRLLVPLMSSAIGKYGHDPYGFTPQTTMLPALYDLARLAKLPEGEERWMLETKAVRDRNRVADTLADATAIIEDALARL